MTNENLRMQMLAGVITEGEYKAKIQENESQNSSEGIDLVRSEMERHINDVNNKEDLTDQEKKRRINNIKFVVYDFLDPNTNGGVRPSNDFQFTDNWWNSIPTEINKFTIDNATSDLVRASRGDSFGEKDTPLNESMIGGIVGIGAINQIPATPKTDYEMAFEHFMAPKYLKEDETSEMEDKVAKETGMNESEVEEGGNTHSISDEDIAKIAKALNTTIQDVKMNYLGLSEELGEDKEVEEPYNY